MSDAAGLYDSDFYLWTGQQAQALRDAREAGVNLPLDWANLAEELESLGLSDRARLRSHIRTILEHLLKLQVSPADEPRPGWRTTVRRTRQDVEDLLSDSPSLRRQVPDLLAESAPRVAKLVAQDLADRGEMNPDIQARLRGASFSYDQVLGDWLPDDPG